MGGEVDLKMVDNSVKVLEVSVELTIKEMLFISFAVVENETRALSCVKTGAERMRFFGEPTFAHQ